MCAIIKRNKKLRRNRETATETLDKSPSAPRSIIRELENDKNFWYNIYIKDERGE